MVAAATLAAAGSSNVGRPQAGPTSGTADCISLATCYTPHQLEVAYGVQPLLQRGIDGRGETVVLPELAESRLSPPEVTNLRQDFAVFDHLFHLPAPRLRFVSTFAGQRIPRWRTGRRSWTPKWSTRSLLAPRSPSSWSKGTLWTAPTRRWRGGTSASAPVWAGIIALADQYAKRHLGFINPAIYRIARSPRYHRAFHGVTAGHRNTAKFPHGTITGYRAAPSWDPVTGWGSPNAKVLVPLLASHASR